MTTKATIPETATSQMRAAEEQGLRDRLALMEQRVEKRMRARRKRRMLTLVLGGSLAMVSAFTLTTLTVQSRELTTEAMVQMVRTKVEPELAGARATMEEHLIEEAPSVVKHGMQSVVDTLPNLRAHLTKGFIGRLDQVNEKFASRVRKLMAGAISESKAALDLQYPNKSDREKLELLGAEVAKRLKKTTDSALDAMYPEYTAEMRRLTADIERLYSESEELMTREDRIKRDLLQTMAILAQREGGGVITEVVQAAAPHSEK